MLNLKKKYEGTLKSLPNKFTVRQAELVGIPKGDLVRLKIRGVLERQRIDGRTYVWVKR